METVFMFMAIYNKLSCMKPPNQAARTPGTNQPETLSPSDRWLVKEEVLDMLCISDRTLQHWRSDGIIPYSRIGNKIWYRLSDIEKLLVSRMV
jgi:hypothetical protein